jgi:nucleotide-binding universal stress UspA family protein
VSNRSVVLVPADPATNVELVTSCNGPRSARDRRYSHSQCHARHGARLTMLHALENFPGRTVFSGSEAWRVVQQLPGRQSEVAKRLESQARRLGQAAAVADVVTGAAAAGIVRAASETNADVIVMGVAPGAWLDRALFGSTLSGVLRRAEVPVLVIPVVGGAEEWSEEGVGQDVMAGVPSQSKTVRIAA